MRFTYLIFQLSGRTLTHWHRGISVSIASRVTGVKSVSYHTSWDVANLIREPLRCRLFNPTKFEITGKSEYGDCTDLGFVL